MKYFTFSLFFIVCLLCDSKAQAARDSALAPVASLFTAMKNADTVLLKSVFSNSVVMQTITEKQGLVSVMTESVADFVAFVGKELPGAADEQITVERVEIDGPLAMVWAAYKFYYKGKYSHCGVDCFQLVRFSDGWKIQYLIDTRRRDACR